ncbi:MAG TPA: hypothetical protein VGO96_07520 [Pyrinomonadaceae bacterium]|jgi:hypothetical protein|nr:hypothetical protein [Pyrinomonadaceae bacterium]
MKKYFYVLTLALALASTAATPLHGQTRARNGRAASPSAARTQATATAASLLASLPASDAVMSVDVRRLLSDALPRAYNNNPAELARINSEIDKFKADTGLDARQIERLVVGVSYKQTAAGKTLVETVAIARGNFKNASFSASNRRMQEQKYAGKTIQVYNVDAQVKLIGLFNLRVTDLAVAMLDANTVAVGKLERVQAAIDAQAGRGRVAPEITALATRDANALLGAGGNIPAWLTQNLDMGNISKSIAAVRQFYSTLGTTANGFNMLTALRTDNASAAQSLSTMITGLKTFAPYVLGQMPAARQRPLRSLVENTKVNTEGSEVLITLELAQIDVAALIDAF